MGIFSEIPAHSQLDVLKKLDFKDFINFKKCSKETVEMTRNFRHRFPFEASFIWFENDNFFISTTPPKEHALDSVLEELVDLKVNALQLASQLTTNQFENLRKVWQQTELKVEELVVFHEQNNSATIDELIKLLKMDSLVLHYYNSSILENLSEIEKVKEVRFYHGEVRQTDLLLLQTPKIHIDTEGENSVAPATVNEILKQWLDNKRQIEKLLIWPFPKDHVEMFENLEYFVLWSPESREYSEFRNLPTENNVGKLRNIYTLKRGGDGKKLFIEVTKWSETGIILREYDDEQEIEQCIRETFMPWPR